MIVSAILAVSSNRVIGRGNQLPWHLPVDLARFKTLTLGHPVVMGRRTFDSIKKPLPGRENWIVTRQKDFLAPGARVVGSVAEAIEKANSTTGEIFLIGGADLLATAWPSVNRLQLTQIHRDFEGDIFWPEPDLSEFVETFRQNGQENGLSYSFITMERKPSALQKGPPCRNS